MQAEMLVFNLRYSVPCCQAFYNTLLDCGFTIREALDAEKILDDDFVVYGFFNRGETGGIIWTP